MCLLILIMVICRGKPIKNGPNQLLTNCFTCRLVKGLFINDVAQFLTPPPSLLSVKALVLSLQNPWPSLLKGRDVNYGRTQRTLVKSTRASTYMYNVLIVLSNETLVSLKMVTKFSKKTSLSESSYNFFSLPTALPKKQSKPGWVENHYYA